ncbi:MAG: T9SS type A sorting domain-containing protein [Bacteroidales bacterium]
MIDTTIEYGTSFTMHTTIGGQYNIYQWYKDSVIIPGATDSTLTLNNVAFSDSGMYSCDVTNSIVPGLTYHRRPVFVHVYEDSSVSLQSVKKEPFHVYPLLANDKLFVDFDLNETCYIKIKLFNMLGMQVNNTTQGTWKDDQVAMDVSRFSPGLYTLTIETNSKSYVYKIIKQ